MGPLLVAASQREARARVKTHIGACGPASIEGSSCGQVHARDAQVSGVSVFLLLQVISVLSVLFSLKLGKQAILS